MHRHGLASAQARERGTKLLLYGIARDLIDKIYIKRPFALEAHSEDPARIKIRKWAERASMLDIGLRIPW
jgi:hypothetical protein